MSTRSTGPRVDWRRRLITAAIAIPGLTYLILSSEISVLLGAMAAVIVGYFEFSGLVDYSLPVNYFLLPALCLPDFQGVVSFVTTMANLLVPLWSLGPREGVRAGLLHVFFVHFFVIPISYVIRLRAMAPYGAELTLMWLLVSFASDAGALVVGNEFGKNLCCPSISPKKTWEGILSGVVFGTIASAALATTVLQGVPALTLLDACALGLLASVFGMMGDLIESGFKRFVDVKDASGLLPGHGGLLDRLDALVASVPVWFFYCQYRAW